MVALGGLWSRPYPKAERRRVHHFSPMTEAEKYLVQMDDREKAIRLSFPSMMPELFSSSDFNSTTVDAPR